MPVKTSQRTKLCVTPESGTDFSLSFSFRLDKLHPEIQAHLFARKIPAQGFDETKLTSEKGLEYKVYCRDLVSVLSEQIWSCIR